MRLHWLGAIALLGLAFAVLAQAPAPRRPAIPASHPPIEASPHEQAASSPWSELADYTLTVKVPPKGDTGTWRFRTFDDPAEVIVDLDTPGPKGRATGSIMLVSGQAIATKGFLPEPGYEVDVLDVATLNLKILTRLLDAAVPGGPAALKGRQAVNAREEKTPIVASTPSASARFDAPWILRGGVQRVDANTIAFQLELDVPAGERSADRVRWAFSGNARGTQKGRVLDDATSLSGWTAYRLGPAGNAKQTHTTLKFGATRLPGPFATLKDLREVLARNP